MIARFLSSRFSGYIAIISVVAILGLVWYIYKEGKNSCVGAVAAETVAVDQKSRKDSHEVRKEEQSFTDIQLDAGLCKLGIVRQNGGCK